MRISTEKKSYYNKYKNVSNEQRKENSKIMGKKIGNEKKQINKMESQLESSKRVNQEKLQSISEELKKTEDKYSLKIVESVSEENDVFGKVIDLKGNIGKSYIEGKFTPEWKGANKDIQWSSEYRYNSTKKI